MTYLRSDSIVVVVASLGMLLLDLSPGLDRLSPDLDKYNQTWFLGPGSGHRYPSCRPGRTLTSLGLVKT